MHGHLNVGQDSFVAGRFLSKEGYFLVQKLQGTRMTKSFSTPVIREFFWWNATRTIIQHLYLFEKGFVKFTPYIIWVT